MKKSLDISTNRRQVLKGMGVAGVAIGGTMIGITQAAAAGEFEINMQLGWLASNGQLGEVAADSLGYYAAEGLTLNITPGGPNVDGVASVASGRANVGQLSSSPSLMLARAAGIPIKCFATGYQQHPFTYFSLKSNPINTPEDMIGKKIGTQGTAKILLRALLAKHQISESDVEIIVMGGDMAPLMTGQVDAVTGWQSNINALKILGDQRNDMRLWDAGVQLYANPYYTTDDNLKNNASQFEAFVRATAKGWAWVYANPDKAAGLLVERYPNLNIEAEKEAVPLILSYVFNNQTRQSGWGTMSKENWATQLKTYSDLGQFKKSTPTVDDVMTLSILDATANDRPKIG